MNRFLQIFFSVLNPTPQKPPKFFITKLSRVILLIGLLFSANSSFAHHLKGGWIYYEYLGNGTLPNTSRYKITVKQYLDCNSTAGQIDNVIYLGVFGGTKSDSLINNLSIPLAGTDWENKVSYGCINPSTPVCYRVDRYITTIDLPNNNEGYVLSVQRCCRIDGIVNLNASDSAGLTYTNKLPGIINGVAYRNDNSPVFTQKDTAVVCQNNYFTFDFSATDVDGDRLSYAFTYGLKGGDQTIPGTQPSPPTMPAPPYDSTVSISYAAPFTYSSPMGPGVTIDPNTGIISGVAPNAIGDYVIAVAVSEYRNNVLIGITRKELHINVANCTVLYAITSQVNTQCMSGPTGSATATGSGGVGPYSYSWNTAPVQNTATAINLAAGTYTVTITDANTCSTSKSITIIPVPKDPAASNNGPLCVGGTLNLYSTTIVGTDYKWIGPNGFTSTLQNPVITNVTAANAGVYSVSATINNCGGASSSTTVVINSLPAAPVVSNNGPLCVGATLNLTASSIAGATYKWSGPNGFSSSLQNPTINNVTTLNAGVYSVYVTVNSCVSPIASTNVIINAIPPAPVASSNSPVCSGTTLNLTAAMAAGYSFNWVGPNGFTSTLQNPSISNVTALNAGVYSVTASANGCISLPSTTTVAVKTAPVKPTVTGTSPICAGAKITFTSTFVSSTTYKWSGPNAFTSTVQNPVINAATVAASGVYSLVLTSTTNGCLSAPATVNVVVNPIPATPVVSNNGPLCVGAALNLNTSAVAGATYNWTGPNAYTSALQNPVINNIATANAGNYSLIEIVNGCSSPGGSTSLIVNTIPAAPTVSNNGPICSGSTLTLNSTAPGGATYSWTGPNSFTSGLPSPSITNATTINGGSYTLSVKVNGCSSSTSNTNAVINFVPAPTPASNGPLCVGSNLNLTASLVAGATYNWTGPNAFVSALQNPSITNVTVSNAGNYSVIASANGCSSSPTSIPVVINPIPAAPVNNNNGPICTGSTLNLFSNFYASGTYSWNGPNSFTSTLQNPVINNATTSNTGAYNLKVSVNGCTSSSTITNAIVNPVTTPSTARNSGPVCEGGVLSLTATTVSGASYSWTGPNGFSSSLQNPVINNITAGGAGTYTLQTIVNSCPSLITTTTVTVKSLPVSPVASSDAPVCEGAPLHLMASSITNASYSWIGPNSFISSVQNPLIDTATSIKAGLYSVMAIVNGCSSSSSSVNVIVKPKPSAAIASSNQPVCQGSALNLNASFVNGVSYTWSGPAGFTSNIQNPVINNVSAANAGSYIVTTTLNGCTNNSIPVNISVTPLPSPSSPSSNSPICEGTALNLNASAVPGTTYNWTGPNAFTSTLQNPVINNAAPVNSGTYWLNTIANGCSSLQSSVSVIVNAIPVAPNVFNNGPLCPGSTLNLSADFISGATYHWSGPNGFTSSLQNPQIINVNASNSGAYSLYIAVNGCNSPVRSTTVNIMGTPASPTMPAHGPVCEGSVISLSTGSVPGASYNWTGPNGFTSTLQNPTINNATIANTGTYNLVISVNGCGSQSTSTDIVVNKIPAAPAVYNNGPICSGSSLNLSTDPIVDANYYWSGPKGFISALQNPSINNADSSNSGTYNLSISVNGCTSPTSSMYALVKPLPQLPIVSNNGPLCEGASLQLYANTINGASYDWSGPGGFTSTVQNPVINNISLANNGSYNLITTVNGCSSSVATTAVVVNQIPAAPVVSNNGALCEGAALNLTANNVSGATYNWSGPNGFTSSLQNPVITNVASSNNGVYSLIVAVNSCTSVSSSTTVIVNPIPASPIVGSNSPLCVGSSLNLTTGAVAGAVYNWVGPNGFVSTLQNPVINNVGSVNAGTYNLIITVNNCAAQSSSAKVIVNPIPSPAIASNSGPLCVGANLNLSASLISGATYNWSGPNGFTSSLQNPVINNITSAGAGNYNLITTVNGCASSISSTSLTVNNIPAAPIVSNNGPLCEGGTLNLLTPNISNASYTWNGPGSFSSTLQNPIINNTSLINAGNYTLTISVNGCTSPSSSTTVLINPLPSVSSVSNNGPLCIGATLLLSVAPVSGASYSWSGPNGFISNLQNPAINNVGLLNSGNYNLSVTVNGCTSPANSTSVIVNPTPSSPTISNNGPLCEGATLNLTSDVITGATYNWTGPNGFSSNLQNPIINNVTSINAGSYSLITIVNGCSSPTASTSLIVNATPSSPSLGNNSPICVGSNLNFSTPSITGASYNWSGPNGFVSTLQNPVINNVDATHGGVYNLSIAINGCASPTSSIDVVINSIPTPPGVHNNGPICEGSTLKLFADTVISGIYSWTGPNGYLSNEQNPSIINATLNMAGAYNVTVSVNGCSSLLASTSAVINSIPASADASNNGPLCERTSLQLFATTITNASYTWTGPNGFISYVQNPVVSNTSVANAGTYNLLTTVNGCSAPVTSTSVVINPIPNSAVITNNGPLCERSALNLSATSVSGATYAWSGPNGFLSTLQNPIINSVSIVNGGTYNLLLTVNGCNSLPASTEVTVNSTPSSGVASNNGPLCEGADLYLSSTGITGAAYHWTGPNGFVSSLHNLVIDNISSVNAGTYSLITSVNGCNSLPATTDVIVNPLPVAPGVFNNGPLCEGSILNLTTNTSADSYSWTGPDLFTSTLQNPSINNVGSINNGSYSLSVIVNGCSSPVSSTIVIINPIPVPATASSNGPLCEGSTLLLKADTVNGASYNWRGPNGFNSTLQNPSISNVGNANAGTYSLITTVNNCASGLSTIDVVVNPIPSAATISNNGPLCEGSTLNLTAESILGATYSWTGPNGFTSNLQSPVINNTTSLNAGVYNLIITVNNCASQTSTTEVIINIPPSAPVITSNSPLCEGSTLNLSTNLISGATYNWVGPNGFTSSLQNPIINNVNSANAGAYNLTTTVNSCASLSSSTNVIINPIPAAPIVSNNGPLCEGSTLNLTTNIISGATYNWTGPNGFTSSLQNPVISNTTSINAGTYNLITTVNNCASLFSSATVIINPIPATPIVSNNGPLCEGSTLNLTTESIIGATYNWSGPNGFTSNLQSPAINNVSLINTGTYTLLSTINNCASQPSTTNVVINPIPTATTVTNNGPLCEGSTLSLTADLISGATYNWVGPNGFTSTLQNPSIANVGSSNAGAYTLVTMVNNCASQTSTTDVIINTIPLAPAIFNNGPLCEGTSLNLSTNLVAGANYAWTGPNGFTSNLQNPVVNNTTSINSGNYFLTVSASGCISQPSSTNVVINLRPDSPLLANNGPLCEGATLILSTDLVAGALYHWTGPNGFTSSLQNPIINNVSSSNAGTYNLIITVNNCASQLSATNIIVNPIPATSIVSNNGPLCEGSNLNLSTNLITGAVYQWIGPNGFTSSLQNPTINNVSSANAGTYNLTTTVNNCASQSSESYVIVNPVPAAPLISNNGPLCEGYPLTLSTDPIAGASYIWTGPNGFTSSLQNPTVNNISSANARTYNLILSVNNCASQLSTTNVIINPIPAAPIVSNNGPLCEGSTLNLSTDLIDGAMYNWTGPKGFSSNLRNPVIDNVKITDKGIYSLMISKNGCNSNAGNTTIEINPKPATPAIVTNSPLCIGSDLFLSTQTLSNVIYNWSGPNGFTSTLDNPIIKNVTGTNAGIYSLTVLSMGCSSESTQASVIINQPLAAPLISSNGPVCAGADIELKSSYFNGNYYWTGPNGFTSNAQYPIIKNVSEKNAGSYQLHYASYNCQESLLSIDIIVNANPIAAITSNGPVCEGADLLLSANSIPGAKYNWFGPNGFFSSNQDPEIKNVSKNNNGNYSLTILSNGCSSNPAFANILIKNKPAVPAINSNSPVCEGGNINLMTSGINGATYNWDGPAGFISNAANPVLNNVTSANAGIYKLYLTANGCSSDPVALNILVNQIPAAPAISNNGPVCEGSDLLLTASGSANGKFVWSGPSGFTSNLKDPLLKNAKALNAGLYKLIYSINGCSANEISTNVVVRSKIPNVSISQNGPLCDSDNLQLRATLIPGASYHWSGPAGFTSNLQNPAINFATINNAGIYSLTVMADGCNLSGASTNVIVRDRVNEPKIVNNSPLCVGATLSLITQNILGASYLWNGPGNFKSDQQNPIINGVTQFNAGSYSLVVTLNGCSSKPGYTEVVVNPKLNLPPASNNGPLCEGATLKLISVSAVGATYLWTGPNGFTSTDQNPAITNVTQKNSGVYHLILNVAGCNSPESSVNVAINAAPETPQITSNDPICEGATLNMSVDNTAGILYNWTGPHGFTFTGNKFSLNNIDTSKSGTYKVIASANGCSSQPAIHSLIINKTPGPVSISSNAPVCEGTTLILKSNAPSNAEFSWSGPNYFKSVIANPVINTAIANNTGLYKLFIKINGCVGNENNINISIKPAPQKPVASSAGKLCEGDIITLNASGNPNTSYRWNGPAGFVSDLQNPTIGNAKMNNSGMYKVYAIDNSCLSLTDSVAIVINPIPSAPIAKSNAPLCDGKALYLSVDQSQNSLYSWSGPNGFYSTLANPIITVANASAAGIYKVLATKNGCTSPQTVINVLINELPVISSISNNGPLCNGNELILSSSAVTGSQYKWIGPAGFTADVPSPHIPLSNVSNKGNYQLTVTRDGCTSKPAKTTVDIREAIKISAGPDQTFCNNAGIINTTATIIGQSNILWTTSGSGTFSPNNFTLNALYVLSASDRQQNSIKLRIKSTDSSACPSVSSIMNINLTGKPVVKAGVDLTICSDITSVPMNANSTANKLYWSTSGDGRFLPDSSSLNPQYIPGTKDRKGAVINLKLFSASTYTCPSVGDGIKLTINPSPIVKMGSDIEILENEFSTLHPQIKGNIISYLWTPGQNMDNPGIKEPVIKGVIDQQYKLTVKDANGCLASDKIMINVLKPIIIPNTFTPNGDGVNDKWMVDFLHQYKNARVQIFNRYGQLVFESKGYNSPWDGTFKGQPVPFGTYYYIIEIGHGKPGVKGYVTVIR